MSLQSLWVILSLPRKRLRLKIFFIFRNWSIFTSFLDGFPRATITIKSAVVWVMSRMKISKMLREKLYSHSRYSSTQDNQVHAYKSFFYLNFLPTKFVSLIFEVEKYQGRSHSVCTATRTSCRNKAWGQVVVTSSLIRSDLKECILGSKKLSSEWCSRRYPYLSQGRF